MGPQPRYRTDIARLRAWTGGKGTIWWREGSLWQEDGATESMSSSYVVRVLPDSFLVDDAFCPFSYS